jgi:glyoxylase-like metal-dependent hydrolase (beta-lactamase superfamily II)
MTFAPDTEFPYGVLQPLTPLIRRIIAHNPGPFSGPGTGTYVIGHGDVAVIDPGPDDADHIAALLAGLGGERVSHILVTHTHIDHSPGARLLQQATGAATWGFGPHGAGLAEDRKGLGGGDVDFVPDHAMGDGDSVAGDGWRLQAVHTPGHCSNHLCFALPQEQALFSGDHVMGWSTTVVSPPDGDMAAYMRSMETLRARGDALYWPTHGAAIRNPMRRIDELIDHRERRRARILERLAAGDRTIAEVVRAIYILPHPDLVPAAGRSVLAQLLELIDEGLVASDGPATIDAVYRLR